jgi:hypothetical protein
MQIRDNLGKTKDDRKIWKRRLNKLNNEFLNEE